MTPFRPIVRDPAIGMMQRCALMQQAPETFRRFFNGRVPTMVEKLQFIEEAVQRMTAGMVYQNDVYTVEVIPKPPFVHLDIRRNDGEPCHNWRDFQQIKNELVGPEHEAIELFPAESRLVDTAHQYHLWVAANPTFRFPLGFKERLASAAPVQMKMDGCSPLRPSEADLLSGKAAEASAC